MYIYVMDESLTVLRPNDSELDISGLAEGGIGTNIMDIAFIPGKDEMVLIDDTGTSRILSLTSEKLRLVYALSNRPLFVCMLTWFCGSSDLHCAVARRLALDYELSRWHLCLPDHVCTFG